MTAISLTADPTFTAKVPIHIPGQGNVEVEFTFKFMDKKQLEAFQKKAKSSSFSSLDYVSSIVVGWELTDEFNKKNLALLLEQRHTAAAAITATWTAELFGARSKN